MKLSTRMRYGTRALIELASAYPDKAMSVKDVAESQSISPKYLEHIMSALKTAGIVKSVRGLHGGYVLAVPPSACHLSDVYQALEGSPAPVECVDDPRSCALCEECPTRDTWAEVKEAIMEVLEHTTLQDLVDRSRRKQVGRAQMYYI